VTTICHSIYDSITADWLKNTFLLGVDLTDDDGNDFPDILFEQAIRSAVSHIENDLGIVIDPWEVRNERHDASLKQWAEVWPIRFDQRPVKSFDSWSVQFGSFPEVDMPDGWMMGVDPRYGQYHIMPSEGSVVSGQLWQGFPLLPSLFNASQGFIPGYVKVNYTAGFDVRCGTATLPQGDTDLQVVLDPEVNDRYRVQITVTDAQGAANVLARNVSRDGFLIRAGTAPSTGDATISWVADTIPNDMKQAIGQLAAMLPLDIAGDLIAGAGIASFSTSMDGISQSIGTTSSATNSGYGSRVLQFSKELKSSMQALRAAWRLPGVGAV